VPRYSDLLEDQNNEDERPDDGAVEIASEDEYIE
jgi:hypothetical protein